jgi:hypothetical protein
MIQASAQQRNDGTQLGEIYEERRDWKRAAQRYQDFVDAIFLMLVKPKHDFAQLEAISVDERSRSIGFGDLVVVHDERIRLREIRDVPTPLGIVHTCVAATDRRRAESHRVGQPCVATQHYLKRLAGDAHESNLAISIRPLEHLEMSWKQLNRLLAWAREANGFSRTVLVAERPNSALRLWLRSRSIVDHAWDRGRRTGPGAAGLRGRASRRRAVRVGGAVRGRRPVGAAVDVRHRQRALR